MYEVRGGRQKVKEGFGVDNWYGYTIYYI